MRALWRTCKDFFRTGEEKPILDLPEADMKRLYERLRLQSFVSVTLGYGMFYCCRVNFSVVKKPMLDEGVLSAQAMGVAGSLLLWTYALGKLANGAIADHANIRRLMSLGLMASALINLFVPFSIATFPFFVFAILWGINGWFQSTGGAPSVVSLSHWFTWSERGTRYGVWSVSHCIGEAITFAFTAMLVNATSWQAGFLGPGILCFVSAIILSRTLLDRPRTYGLPEVHEYKGETPPVKDNANVPTSKVQMEVLLNYKVWVLGGASALMYVSRYGINNWGVLYLQVEKGYSLVEAGSLLSMYPVVALAGSALAGLLSDRLFNCRRNVPALLCGVLQVLGLLGLKWVPGEAKILHGVCLAIFGFATGALLVYLGGLMAIDIVPQRVAGVAAGLVGFVSYFGAGLQDIVSGFLLEQDKVGDKLCFDRTFAFWVFSACLSAVLATVVWGAGKQVREKHG
jgi:OPA family sugar phosphate sensor protein UhpC-like MFS transporter